MLISSGMLLQATTLDSKSTSQQNEAGVYALSAGGELFLVDVEGSNFGDRLQNAIDAMPNEGGIINCRGVVGSQTMNAAVNIDKPVRILLGQMVLTMNNSENENMFNILSSGVDIIGLGRSVKKGVNNGKTRLIMAHSAGDALQGYHIYNKGNSCIRLQGFDLIGVRTTIGHYYMSKLGALNGAGGIYMEKKNPGHTQSGNNISQVIIEEVYIESTKAHAIYMDTPMLCTLNNVRISKAGGHGVFISGGTTCTLNSVYVSSANYAGFVFYHLSYSSVLNSVAEYCGMGWWIRSCNSLSVFNPGVEETKNIGLPWGTESPYGLNLFTSDIDGTIIPIKDINSDYFNEFVGHGYLISGGESIQLFSPYCKDPGNATATSDIEKSNKTRFLKVTSNNKNSSVLGLKIKLGTGHNLINDFDVEIGADVKYFNLEWNPKESGTVTPSVEGEYITTNKKAKAPLLLQSNTTLVKSGNRIFTPFINE